MALKVWAIQIGGNECSMIPFHVALNAQEIIALNKASPS